MSLSGRSGARPEGAASGGRPRGFRLGGRDGREAFGGELRARRRRIGVWCAGRLGGGGSGAQRAAVGHRPIIAAEPEFFFTDPATLSGPAPRRACDAREAVNFGEHQAVLLAVALSARQAFGRSPAPVGAGLGLGGRDQTAERNSAATTSTRTCAVWSTWAAPPCWANPA
ncbi:hypothetical protein GCM10010345_90630 [Streptomyces canarius]|uniref:Beta-ketoacyl synthase N-terminal domain-containing protein n=1 Tax=Streptomyces canarius TaxID=285453 RepID=A0ABQ3DAY3_9ACTN|nr:hypothetical protein GCM10010345_90630 [Streptomyces canarius]